MYWPVCTDWLHWLIDILAVFTINSELIECSLCRWLVPWSWSWPSTVRWPPSPSSALTWTLPLSSCSAVVSASLSCWSRDSMVSTGGKDLYYYCDMTSQEFQPMAVQLSLKAAPPLAERIVTVSDCYSKYVVQEQARGDMVIYNNPSNDEPHRPVL